MPNTSSSVFGHGRPPQGPDPTSHATLSRLNRPVEATHLGQTVEYKTEYDPSLLVAVPRQENRTGLGITLDSLPFVGYDVWNAYEVSCLTLYGVPCVFIVKIMYPADSPSIVESKSLKLYLNSFNMSKVGINLEETIMFLRGKIRDDLSNLLETKVHVQLFDPLFNASSLTPPGNCLNNLLYSDESEDLQEIVYTENPNLIKTVEYTDFEKYEFEDKSDPTLIPQAIELMENWDTDKEIPEPQKGLVMSQKLYEVEYTDLLRSNCKVTHEPDWGTIVIAYKGKKKLNRKSLLKYIISFRNENHFHEEICEAVFTTLKNNTELEAEELLVACFYTRRGGIDINPIRATSSKMINIFFKDYININKLSPKATRQ